MNRASVPTALLEECYGVIGVIENMPWTANFTYFGGDITGRLHNQGVAMFDGFIKVTLGDAFHELLNSGDFEVKVEDVVTNEPGGSRGSSEETVLEGLHPMDMVGLCVREDCAGICHDWPNARCVNAQFAPQ